MGQPVNAQTPASVALTPWESTEQHGGLLRSLRPLLDALGRLTGPDQHEFWRTTISVSVTAAMAVVDLCLVLLVQPGGPTARYLLFAGLLAVSVVLAPTLVYRSRGLPVWVSLTFPFVNMVLLGVMSQDPASHADLAMYLSAWWVGSRQIFRGVAVTAAAATVYASTAVAAHPQVALHSLLTPWSSLILLSVASAFAALTFGDTARQAKEVRLQRDQLFDALDVGVAVMDAQGTLVSTNPRFRHFAALASPEVEPQRVGEDGQVMSDASGTLVPLVDLPTVRAARGDEFDSELVWVGPAEHRVALSVSCRRLAAQSDDRFRGAVLAYYDVSDLVRAVRVKDDFVASVSHELRTPLTSIVGYVEYVAETETNPHVTDYLGRVRHNALRLARLVEDLLHTTNDRIWVRPIETNVAELLPIVWQATQARAERAGIRVDFEAQDTWVDGDPQRLEQVLENLVTNSIKYGRRGGWVKVSCEPVGAEAVIRVSDNGIGMSDQDRRHVFDRFFRSTSIRTDAIAGVGLGLAICRDLVAAHHGTITVDSTLGVGSAFEVRLPLRAESSRTFAVQPPRSRQRDES